MNNELENAFGQRLRVRASGIFIAGEKVLLVGLRGLVDGMLYWCPPGGGVNFGERVRDAVSREILEETGLNAEVGRFMFFREFLRPPLHAIELYFEVKIDDFSGYFTGKDPELDSHKQLISEVGFFTLSEIDNLPRQAVDPVFHHLSSLEHLRYETNWSTIQKDLI